MAFEKKKTCPPYEIRLMTDDDIEQVLDIWKEIGLYEGKYSIKTFKSIDPRGFYVAVNLEDGKIIGCCGGAESHPDCIFIGLYAVRKKYQGLGIGLRTFGAVMKHVGNKNAGLYPVEHHLVTYRDKAGFTERDTHKVIVYEIEDACCSDDLVHHISNVKIEPVREEYLDAIVAFDEKIVKHRREKLLRLTFNEPESISRVAIDLDNGNILAFGSLRVHNVADKVMGGPIYALNDGVAELLLYHLIKDFPPVNNGLTLMIPDINYGAQRMAKKLKIVELYRLCRLFTKRIPKAEVEKIYSIHSPNFYPF